jgi:hypothetical protein
MIAIKAHHALPIPVICKHAENDVPKSLFHRFIQRWPDKTGLEQFILKLLRERTNHAMLNSGMHNLIDLS